MSSDSWRWTSSLLVSLCLASPSWALFIEDEYKDKIKVSEGLQPLGDTPFGEQISLYNGALTFKVTDIDLPGTGLPIRISRTFTAGKYIRDAEPFNPTTYGQIKRIGELRDWDLNIPRITTLVATGQSSQLYGKTWSPDNRCTQIDKPVADISSWDFGGPIGFSADDWWDGYNLIDENGDHQQLLRRAAGNDLEATFSGPGLPSNFDVVTQKHWQIGCLPQTTNGAPGEAFFAISPDGVKYWFTHMVYSSWDNMKIPKGTTLGSPSPYWILYRKRASLMVTRMEDRFGNYLTFTYGAVGTLPTSITSSDDRQVTFTPLANYSLQITVQPQTAGPRTWTYTITTGPDPLGTLSSVTLPDGRQWVHNLRPLSNINTGPEDEPSGTTCDLSTLPPYWDTVPRVGSITHPYGLTGTFTVAARYAGRSYVPLSCRLTVNGKYAVIPALYPQPSLTERVLNVSGVTHTWNYQYSTPNGSYANNCSNGCATTITTKVIEPDSTSTTYTFSNRWGHTEGQQSQAAIADAGSATVRTTTSEYAPTTYGPYPAQLGTLFHYTLNSDQLTKLSPTRKTEITQGLDKYSWEVPLNGPDTGFDRYGKPRRVKRYNNISSQVPIQELTDYADDPTWSGSMYFRSHWVLGETRKVTEETTGKVLAESFFDPSDGTLLERWAFGRKAMSYDFDAQGNLASFTDPRSDPGNHTTTLANYKLGIPRQITFPDLTQLLIGVSDFAEVTSVTDESGNTTGYEYDFVSRLTKITFPAGWAPRTFTYTTLATAELGMPIGTLRMRSVHDRLQVSTYYDSLLRPVLVEEKDTSTGIAKYRKGTFDHQGRQTFASYPSADYLAAIGTSSKYDALGRLIEMKATVDGVILSAIQYLAGNQKSVKDARLNTTVITYQAFDQPSYESATRIDAPEGQTTVIGRDVFGNMLAATQSGSYEGAPVSVTRSYVYDANNRLCKRIEPETGQSVIAYDEASNIDWSADGQAGSTTSCDYAAVPAASKTDITYNLRNRLILADAPGTDADVTTTYWPNGDTRTISNSGSTWTYNYNSRRLLEDETLSTGGINFRLDYAYNVQGLLNQLTYPSNRTVALSPDAFGRSTSVGTYAASVLYHPNDTVNSFSYGNGLGYSLAIDGHQRPERLRVFSGGTDRINLFHEYDSADNLWRITDWATSGADSRELGYDDLNRLETATGLWGAYTYKYDPLNNIRARTGPNSLTYAYNSANRLASVSGGTSRSYGYNAEGQVTSDGSKTFTWNGADRISSISGVATYAYDGAGKRIKTTKSSGEIEYTVYSRAGTMLHSYKPGTGEAIDFIYLGSVPVAEVKTVSQTTTTTYLHADLLNSPIQWSTSSGALSQQEHYEAYGQKMNGVADKLGYTAHVFDDNTGLTYMQARFYDAAVGRFLSQDPVGFSGAGTFLFNRYAYANNNPYRYVDPTGMAGEAAGTSGSPESTTQCSGGQNDATACKISNPHKRRPPINPPRSANGGTAESGAPANNGTSEQIDSGVNLRLADSASFMRSLVRSVADDAAQLDVNILNVAVVITPGVSAARAALGSAAGPKALCFFCTGLNPTVDAHGAVILGRGSTQMLKIEAMRERAQSGLQLETRLRSIPTLPE